MKEKIYTIPLMDAFHANDECPFCFIERRLEQHAIEFILGSAYMEDDVRMETDKIGFCRHHYKMMFDYGNRLGSALILSTHFHHLNGELSEQLKAFSPGKSSVLKRIIKANAVSPSSGTNIASWVAEREKNCYVCNHFISDYNRYLDTFFEMLRTDPDFVQMVKDSKGFCLHHFGDLVDTGAQKLNDKQKDIFLPILFKLMTDNLKRLEEEVTWFTDKYDYRNKDKDWGNSRDSVQRCMQKLSGGYPADPPFQSDK